jgi:hypothetical protein
MKPAEIAYRRRIAKKRARAPAERPDPHSAVIAAYVADPAKQARIDSILENFARVCIARPSRSAIIDVATDCGMSHEAASLVADVIEYRLVQEKALCPR